MKQIIPHSEFTPTSIIDSESVTVKGNFFFLGKEKFFLKGVTYGTFAPASHGSPLPERQIVKQDLSLMAQLGANCLRTYTVPPQWFLDLAAAYGIRVLVGIPWAQKICFLDSASIQREIRQVITNAVKACGNHPAIFGYLVGNEIPTEIVRWHGAKRIRTFLRELVNLVKEVNPKALVSYANYPSTEYLETDFADFISFNVYLHEEEKYRKYLSRLLNLAVAKPLVLSEFGIDSIREGLQAQAEILSWKVRSSFEMGAAGTIVFAWTDDWFALSPSGEGGSQVEDWAFGLVDRDRHPKPVFEAVQQQYNSSLPPALPEYPKVSVVVCAYNAEPTMDSCLASLQELNYPNYEVIVVNDGSTDGTRAIAESYDYIRLINQENKGLSVARNVGLKASIGDIVAYTDSDCDADPDWLTYLVAKFLSSDIAAVGGPNFPPPEDALIPSVVAVSPGGPTHVLLSDEVAEHIAGCNMAFRREILEELGGFDPIYRAAGDDVDVCWRLQDRGYEIGFSPGAIVWHFRRNTLKAYIKQQQGYGKAESLVYFKHPYRFNSLGQARWLGTIYGGFSGFPLLGRPLIYSGSFGRGLFQTLYQPPVSLFSYLPLTLEWNVAAGIFLVAVLLAGGSFWLALVPFLLSWIWAGVGALRAPIDPRFRGLRARLLVALLIYLGPLARSLERYRWRFKGLSKHEPIEMEKSQQKLRISWLKPAFSLSYWTEDGHEKESLIQGLMEFLEPRQYFIVTDQGWNDWDLKLYRGLWARAEIKFCAENHGNSRLLRAQTKLKISRLATFILVGACILAAIAMSLNQSEITIAMASLGCLIVTFLLYKYFRLGNIVYRSLEKVAKDTNLLPIDTTKKRTIA